MPSLSLGTTFQFAASHFLTKYHGKCENLHGHNYKLIIIIKDDIKDDDMVMDFKKIKEIVNKAVIDRLDHAHLNDIMENPSAERISVWIWENLKDKLPLAKTILYETEDYYCEYEGE
ncbi:MAG: 6-carboxytetrahydropterin synthase QueD [Candidatus Peregrinibacteria bacterium]